MAATPGAGPPVAGRSPQGSGAGGIDSAHRGGRRPRAGGDPRPVPRRCPIPGPGTGHRRRAAQVRCPSAYATEGERNPGSARPTPAHHDRHPHPPLPGHDPVCGPRPLGDRRAAAGPYPGDHGGRPRQPARGGDRPGAGCLRPGASGLLGLHPHRRVRGLAVPGRRGYRQGPCRIPARPARGSGPRPLEAGRARAGDGGLRRRDAGPAGRDYRDRGRGGYPQRQPDDYRESGTSRAGPAPSAPRSGRTRGGPEPLRDALPCPPVPTGAGAVGDPAREHRWLRDRPQGPETAWTWGGPGDQADRGDAVPDRRSGRRPGPAARGPTDRGHHPRPISGTCTAFDRTLARGTGGIREGVGFTGYQSPVASLAHVSESPDAVFSRLRGGLGSRRLGRPFPGTAGVSPASSPHNEAFSILRAYPKPAGCRRSRRTGLPARRLPNRQDRQFAW